MNEHRPVESEHNLEEALFEAAITKDSAEEREKFLNSACGEDESLRSRLEVLVEGYFEGEGFLTQTPDREPASATSGDDFSLEGPGARSARYKLLQPIGEGGLWVGLHGRAEGTGAPPGGAQDHQAGDGHAAGGGALRSRAPGAGHDGPPEYRAGASTAGPPKTGRPYFVMELVKGEPITRYCDEHEALRPGNGSNSSSPGLPGDSARPPEGDRSTATSSLRISWSPPTTGSQCPRSSTSGSPKPPSST